MMRTLLAVVLFATSLVAHANVSVGSGASESIETSGSSKTTRDRSISVDTSKGKKSSTSKSSDSSKETSKDKRSSKSSRVEKSARADYSAEIDINALLIGEFVRRYEQAPVDDASPIAKQYFSACGVFTRAMQEYPVLQGHQPIGMGQATPYGANPLDPRTVVPLQAAWRISVETLRAANGGSSLAQGMYYKTWPVEPRNPTIRRYAECRLTAHFFLSRAGALVAETPALSQSDAKLRITSTFDALEQQEFAATRQRARETWAGAFCSPWLVYGGDYAGQQIECNVLTVRDGQISVDGVATLSAAAIDGKRYKLALASGDTQSAGTSTEESSGTRTASSSRTSHSVEAYSDGKKTASLKASRGRDSSDSTRTSTDSKSEISASPVPH